MSNPAAHDQRAAAVILLILPDGNQNIKCRFPLFNVRDLIDLVVCAVPSYGSSGFCQPPAGDGRAVLSGHHNHRISGVKCLVGLRHCILYRSLISVQRYAAQLHSGAVEGFLGRNLMLHGQDHLLPGILYVNVSQLMMIGVKHRIVREYCIVALVDGYHNIALVGFPCLKPLCFTHGSPFFRLRGNQLFPVRHRIRILCAAVLQLQSLPQQISCSICVIPLISIAVIPGSIYHDAVPRPEVVPMILAEFEFRDLILLRRRCICPLNQGINALIRIASGIAADYLQGIIMVLLQLRRIHDVCVDAASLIAAVALSFVGRLYIFKNCTPIAFFG